MPFPWDKQKNREWRARLGVRAFAQLPETFTFSNLSCTSRELATEPDGVKCTLVEYRFLSEDIETAYFQACDAAEELADRIAFLSFAATEVTVLSVTYPNVALGELFEIAMPPMGRSFRSTVAITTADIAQLDQPRSGGAARALRLLRTGISSDSSYHALAQLWAAAEVIARERAEQDGNYRTDKCDSCGEPRKTGEPRTQPYVTEFISAVLEQDGHAAEAPKVAKKTRETRGKVIHGGKLQNEALRIEVSKATAPLLSAAVIGLSKALGAKASTRLTGLVGSGVFVAQLAAHAIMVPGGDITMLQQGYGKWVVRSSAAAPRLPKDFGREDKLEDIAITFGGLSFPLAVQNSCWPTIDLPAGPPEPPDAGADALPAKPSTPLVSS
jgi:hypothetical protein